MLNPLVPGMDSKGREMWQWLRQSEYAERIRREMAERCTCSPVDGIQYDCPEHGADAVAGRTAVASPPPPDGVQLYDALLGLVTCLDEGGNGEGWTIEEFLVPARAALENAAAVVSPPPSDAVRPEQIVEQRAKGWPDFHPETYCHRCGRRNIDSWFVSSALWNAAHIEDEVPSGIVCPQCFVEKFVAAEAGDASWELRADPCTLQHMREDLSGANDEGMPVADIEDLATFAHIQPSLVAFIVRTAEKRILEEFFNG